MLFSARRLFFVCLLALPYLLQAQGPKKITVTGDAFPERDVFFVGEIHSINEKEAFNQAMFQYVQAEYGVPNLVREYGPGLAYLFNCYLKYRDTTIFRYMQDPKTRENLEAQRIYNNGLPEAQRMTCYGIDFDRMEFVSAVRLILHKNAGTENTELYKYVYGLPDSILGNNELSKVSSKLRIQTYGAARTLFEKEREVLSGLVHTDYAVLENILANPTTEKHFAKRDKGMYENMRHQLKGKKYLCVVGQMHTVYSYHNVQTSLAKRLLRNGTHFNLITEVAKASYSTYQWFHSKDDTAKRIYPPGGPSRIIDNKDVMALAYTRYYKRGYFNLIGEGEFKEQGVKQNHGIPTYYVFFDYPPLD